MVLHKLIVIFGTVLLSMMWLQSCGSQTSNISEDNCVDEEPFPNPEECTSYHQCLYDTEEEEWNLATIDCDDGGHFDMNSGSCVGGACPGSGEQDRKDNITVAPSCSPLGSVGPRSGSPTEYYKCLEMDGIAQKQVLKCEPGTCFDTVKQNCSTEACPKSPGSSEKFECNKEGKVAPYPKNPGWYRKCTMMNGTLETRIFGCKVIGSCFDPVTLSCVQGGCPNTSPGTKQPACLNPGTVAPYPKNPGWYYKCVMINGTIEKRIFGCKVIGSCFDPETNACKDGICPNSPRNGTKVCLNVNTVEAYPKNPAWHIKCVMINGTLHRRIFGCKPKGTCFDTVSNTCKAGVCPKSAS